MSLKVTPVGACSSQALLLPKQGGNTRNENGFERSRGNLSRGTLPGNGMLYLLSINVATSFDIRPMACVLR